MKLVICTPTTEARPFPQFIEALEASVGALDDAGIDHAICQEAGSAYISHARAKLLRKALDAKADTIIFLDHDLSWNPGALVTLANADAEVCGGTYRFRKEEVEYMGTLVDGPGDRPVVRDDGLIRAELIPAGFLKVTRKAVRKFMRAYPELLFGDPTAPSVDLFNHGVHDFVWWGEDYAFCRRWRQMGEMLWIVPDLNITHHNRGGESFPGNFHEFLLRQPGGSNAEAA